MKRSNYLSWDEYFMGVALLSAQRSKDPQTQVGACIVSPRKIIIGIGYNGFPLGCDDDEFPWANKGAFLETKYPYVVHAELNAVLNASGSVSGATLYTTLFPCNECAKIIIQAGITEIVYLSAKYAGTETDRAAKKLLTAAGIALRQLSPFTLELVCPNEL